MSLNSTKLLITIGLIAIAAAVGLRVLWTNVLAPTRLQYQSSSDVLDKIIDQRDQPLGVYEIPLAAFPSKTRVFVHPFEDIKWLSDMLKEKVSPRQLLAFQTASVSAVEYGLLIEFDSDGGTSFCEVPVCVSHPTPFMLSSTDTLLARVFNGPGMKHVWLSKKQ